MRRQVQVALALALAVPLGARAADETPARVERAEWVATLSPVGEARTGVAAEVEVTLEARGTFHVNADYPTSFRASPAGAVRYPKARVDKSSGLTTAPCPRLAGEACGARARVPFVADASGAHTMGGVFAFSVCDKERCLIEKVTLAVPVTVR